jgi:hypothetical protein
MSGAWLGGILGQAYSHGVEVELGSGVDFIGDLYARYNATTGRVEVWSSVVVGATAGNLIIVNDAADGWDESTPAAAVRRAYDEKVEDVAVAHDAAPAAAITLFTVPLADFTDRQSREVTVQLHVTDGVSVDVLRAHAVFERHDDAGHALANVDDSPATVSTGSDASVDFTIATPLAADIAGSHDEIVLTIAVVDTDLVIGAWPHASVDRTVTARLYVGEEDGDAGDPPS